VPDLQWWAVLGSNQWPLPRETEVGCLQINDMRAVPPKRFFDTGHFALETHASEIAATMRQFLARWTNSSLGTSTHFGG
jgi:hypothetical protein